MKRVFIIHRWDGTPKDDWYPWIKERLTSFGYVVHVPKMPDTEHPKIRPWVEKLRKEVGKPDSETFFIGHSIGVQTIFRYLESLPESVKVGGVVSVAGWLGLNLDPKESPEEYKDAEEWLKTPIDWKKVRSHSRKFLSIFSDNDSFVPLGDRNLFRKNLGSEIVVEKRMGHFTFGDGITRLETALYGLVDIDCEEYVIKRGGKKIIGMLHNPSGKGPWPLIVISHWFKGNMEDFDDLAQYLTRKFIVYRFDYNDLYGTTEIPFKGLTVSRELDTLNHVIKDLKQHPQVKKGKIGLFGHSLGGTLSYLHAAEDPDVRVLVLASPVSNWKQTFVGGKLANTSAFSELGDKFQKDAMKYNLRSYAGKINVPTLIMYGDKDETVKLENINELMDSLGGKKKLVVFQGDNHDLLKDWDKAMKLTINWFEKYL